MLSDGTDGQRLGGALRQLEQVTAEYIKLEDEIATLRARVEAFERLARMVVGGQLTETEHERGIYRRGFRALLDAARASAGERGEP